MKINFIWALGMMTLMFASCSDRIENITESNESVLANELYAKGYVYPLSKAYQAMNPITRSGETSFETDWENKQFVYTYSGEKANLPWANVTDSNIPLDIALDVKKADGWQMLLHTLTNSPGGTRDLNYMVLYNIRTGILKVFYYIESNPQMNNAGIWELSFSNSHQMFNATRDFTFPMEMETNTHWGCTNLVTNKTKGFLRGWNSFQVLLTYDQNENASDRYIDIITHSLNESKDSLLINMEGYSSGTIITQGSQNPLAEINNKIATVAGKNAEEWINNKYGSKISPETRSAILAAGASAIVKAGLNKLLDNFTATLKKPTETRSDVTITTTTTGKIVGNRAFNSSSPTTGLRTLFSESLVGGKLGAWNLTSTPTIYLYPLAGHVGNGNYRLFGSSTRSHCEVAINPRLAPYIVSQKVEHDIIPQEYPDFPYNSFDPGEMGDCYDYGRYGDGLHIYYDKYNKFQSKLYCNIYSKYGKDLPAIFVPNEGLSKPRTFAVKRTKLRVTLTLVTDIEGKRDTTVSTRTFVPKFEWDPIEYERYKDVDFSKLERFSCPQDIYGYPDN